MAENKLAPWQTEEGSTYLEQFRSLDAGGFAVIKIGGELIDNSDQLSLMAADLAILGSLGLYPVVVHGGGLQIDKGLNEMGIESKKINGIRITPPEVAVSIASILGEVNDLLTAAVNYDQVVAKGVKTGVFSGKLTSYEDFGSVESVTVSTDQVQEVLEYGLIPVISCVGNLAVQSETIAGSSPPININADIAASAIARVLKPHKFIALTTPGAVLNNSGEKFNTLTAVEAEALINDGVISGGMAVKVRQLLVLLELGVHDIVITSPQSLLTELFTDVGSGTLISQG